MHPDGIPIYRKDTHTGQYVNFKSFTNWQYKIAWIRPLITRAKGICSHNKLKQELAKIKLFDSYNGYPKRIVNAIIRKCNDNQVTKKEICIDEKICSLYLALPYLKR